MKRVSFKVAKAIKEAGYPQEIGEYYYSFTGHLFHEKEADNEETESLFLNASYAAYVMEVWLWVWREKGIQIIHKNWLQPSCIGCIIENNNGLYHELYLLDKKDPEDVIIAAIEYLVDNNLIK